MNDELIDKKVSRAFPFVYKDLTFILRPDFKEIYVYKNNKMINSTLLTQSVIATDYNFYYNKNTVVLSFFRKIIIEYDIDKKLVLLNSNFKSIRSYLKLPKSIILVNILITLFLVMRYDIDKKTFIEYEQLI